MRQVCLVCTRSSGAEHPATGLSISRGCWYNKGTTNDKYHVWCGYSTTDDTEIVKCINNFKLCTDHCICTITNALQNCPHFMVEITHFDKESVSLQISHIILTAFPDIASVSWSVKSNLFIPLQSRAKGQLEALDSGFSDGRAEGKHHQRIHSTTPRWFSSHTTHLIKLLFCPNLLPELKLKGSKTYKLYLARFFFFCKCCHYQISE